MFNATVKIKEIQMILTEEEASWLMWYMQNPMMADESPKDSEMRKTFFCAMKEALNV